jgi:hypothetical protein
VYADVAGFIAQRIRWDGCLIRIYSRKYLAAIDPFRSDFRVRNVFAFLDVFAMQVIPCLVFPLYLLYLWYFYGQFSLTILTAMILGYMVMHVISFGAALMIGVRTPLRLIPYIPFYTIMRFFLARAIMLAAIVMELLYINTDTDGYIPRKIQSQSQEFISG